MPSVGTSPGQYQPSSSSRSLGASAEPAEKAFFCADLDGGFVSCNAAFTRLLGYTPEELTGRDFSALFSSTEKLHVEDGQIRKRILQLISAGQDFQSTLLVQPKSGPTFAVQFSATVLRGSFSRPVEIAATISPVIPTARSDAQAAASDAAVIRRNVDGTTFILASPVMREFMGMVDRVGVTAKL